MCIRDRYKGGIIPLETFAAMKQDNDILVRILVRKKPGLFTYQAMRIQRTDFPVLTCALSQVEGEYRACLLYTSKTPSFPFRKGQQLRKDPCGKQDRGTFLSIPDRSPDSVFSGCRAERQRRHSFPAKHRLISRTEHTAFEPVFRRRRYFYCRLCSALPCVRSGSQAFQAQAEDVYKRQLSGNPRPCVWEIHHRPLPWMGRFRKTAV